MYTSCLLLGEVLAVLHLIEEKVWNERTNVELVEVAVLGVLGAEFLRDSAGRSWIVHSESNELSSSFFGRERQSSLSVAELDVQYCRLL